MTNNIHESNVQQIDHPPVLYPAGNCEEFWIQCAKNLEWFDKWEKINASYNCLDRHIKTETRDKIAYIFIGKTGEERIISFFDLYKEVNRLASSLKSLGLKKGDCAAIFMPLVPEAIVSMLACCRLGIRHVALPLDNLKEHISSVQPQVLITTDELKETADNALNECPSVKDVIIVKTTDCLISFQKGRDHWYQALLANADNYCLPEKMDTEDPFLDIYPFAHNTGRFLVSANASTHWLFDLDDEDLFWCLTDLSSIEGHSFIVYGPLTLGATQLICENPNINPWPLIEKYNVSVFAAKAGVLKSLHLLENQTLTSPEAELAIASEQSDLSSLRLLGSLGQPLSHEIALWLYEDIGQENCDIVDVKMQPENGAVVRSPLPFGE